MIDNDIFYGRFMNKMTSGRPLFPFIAGLFLLATREAGHNAMAQDLPKADAKPSLKIHVEAGTYYLVATGDDQSDTIVPLRRNIVDFPIDLTISVFPSQVERDQRIWKFSQELTVTTDHAQGSATSTFRSSATDGPEVKDVPPISENISRLASLQNIQIMRVPFAEVKGHTRFILVVTTKNKSLFKELFSAPKTGVYADFDWDKWD